MRILVVGATGTIGRAVVAALSPSHDIVPVTRRHTAMTADLAQPDSIQVLFQALGQVDAVVCAAGDAKFAPLDQLSDSDFQFSLEDRKSTRLNSSHVAISYAVFC